MKEYKTVTYMGNFSFSLEKKDKNLTNFLNEHAKQGWKVIESQNMTRFILERDKNR